MNKTSIEWTHRPETAMGAGGFTWNPIHAHNSDHGSHSRTGNFCTKISPGCAHCYASRINLLRGNGLEYTVPNLLKAIFYLDEHELERPLRRKQPATIFVGDMFDLFHEAIPVTFVGRVFGMMAKCPQHTFQVLTKRAQYMQEILSRARNFNDEWLRLPLPNVWIGVSVEDQSRADERIPQLLATPAAVRFLSVEPQLEHVCVGLPGSCTCATLHMRLHVKAFHGSDPDPRISWVICGGESGPGARPFNLAWAESLLKQCRDAGVPFFMKQIGSKPVEAWDYKPFAAKDRKGGDPEEWPLYLRVREFPAPKSAEVLA